MRASVFTDPALVKHAGQFAWLSMNTEKPQGAAFLERFPVENWPTFYVVDSRSESPLLKWEGSATALQLEKLFEDGERAARKTGGDPAELALARADRANAEGHRAEAVALYQEAIQLGGPSWPRRARAIEFSVVALQLSHDFRRCAEMAQREGPHLPLGPTYANVALTGLGCAVRAPSGEPWRAGAISTLEPRVQASLDIPGLLADDRSGLYEALIHVREDAHDEAAAKKLAAQWLAFLENEAAKAPTVEGRAAFDPHRLAAARKLGDIGRVLPALQASERDLPEDYNPSIRLAVVYRELGQYEEALASAKRALAKAYGPRRLGVFETTASIYERKKDPEGARRTLEEALQYAETLPKAQRSEKTIQRLRLSLSQVGQAR